MDMFYFKRLLCMVLGHSSTCRRLGGDYCKRCGELLMLINLGQSGRCARF